MDLLKRWIKHARMRIASMSRRAQLVAAALALLIAAGGAWLIVASAQPDLAPVLAQPMGAEALAAAKRLLTQRGIAWREEAGRLLVARPAVQEARAILAREGVLPHETASSFEQLARESDIWCSQAQSEKRWQAAKMATLGKLIAVFPSVQSATVIFDPGTPGKLGNAGEPPSAAVKVTLKPSARMSDRLATAIADLVAGSTSGMNRQNVRVVDSAGVSYRVSEPAAPGDNLERLRSAEAYYLDRIHAALAYIDNAIVVVQVAAEPAAKCLGASVSVPRSYLAAVHRASRGGGSPSDEEIQALATANFTKIQQAVMRAIGTEDPAVVKTDWYYDVPAEATERPAEGKSAGWFSGTGGILACTAIGAAGVLGAINLLLRRRATKRRALPAMEEPLRAAPAGGELAEADGAPADPVSPRFFAFLQDVPGRDLLGALQDEHPQTIALVLANLSHSKAAEVLGGLSASRQVEIARRIAALERIDPNVAAEVEHTLAARLGGRPAGQEEKFGGVAAIAGILQHAGYATEQAVLEGLSPSQPLLAESIRRRLFAFEDIVHIPSDRLAGVLETVDSDDLAVALRTASEQIQEKVLSSLPASSARQVREEMERIGPVRLSDVEAAQQRVVEVVRRCEDGRYEPAAEVGRSGVLA